MTRPPAESPMRFEDHLAQLEEVIEQLEDGELGLDQSLAAYERGVQLLQKCHQLLEKAERRIEVLQGIGAGGEPEVGSFDEGALSLEQKAARRSRRRTHSRPDGPGRRQPNGDGDVDDAERLF